MGGQGVRVNAIAPGYVQTEFITMLSAAGILDAEKLARRTPHGTHRYPLRK